MEDMPNRDTGIRLETETAFLSKEQKANIVEKRLRRFGLHHTIPIERPRIKRALIGKRDGKFVLAVADNEDLHKATISYHPIVDKCFSSCASSYDFTAKDKQRILLAFGVENNIDVSGIRVENL